jgi:hypothetical protein
MTSAGSTGDRNPGDRAAAALAWISGLGFGLPAGYGTWHFARTGEVWYLMGLPTYGDGPFEELGVPTSVPLLVGFTAVCAPELIAGALLWRGRRRRGTWLALGLLPVESIYWFGFALPFGPVLGLARTALVLKGLWRRTL